MKSTVRIVVIALLVVTGSTAHAVAEFRVGAAHVKITPNGPIPLAGYGSRWGGLAMKKSTGVHDDLCARAVVLEDGGTKFALVACDLCVINAGLRKAACRVLAKADTGIPADHVMVTGTHTHAGSGGYILSILAPPVAGFYNPGILKKLSTGIAEAVVQANAALAPARFGVGSRDLDGYNHNRRGGETLDTQMTVLRFDGADGKPIALVVHFAAHPTIIDGTDMKVSRGWPGAMVDAIREHFGGKTEVLFCNGAEGDASPAGPRPGKDNYERAVGFGKRIAKPAVDLAEGIKAGDQPELKIVYNQFALPPSILGKIMPKRSAVHRVEIGETWLMGLPGEPIMQIGLDIKAEARKLGARHPIVIGLADDHLMYFVTREWWPKNTYEVTMNMYGPAIEDTLVRAVLGDRLGKTGPDEAELMAGAKITRGPGAPLVRLAGSHYQMGYQHGKLLEKDIHQTYNEIMGELVKTVEPKIKKGLGDHAALAGVTKLLPGGPRSLIEPFLAIVARKLNAHTPPELREEMMGLADGAGLSYDAVFLVNSLVTLGTQGHYTKLLSDFSICANVIRVYDDPAKPVIHARNVDWGYRKRLAPLATVFEFHPEKGNAFLSVAFPGVVGVLTAINDKQLSLGNETVNSKSDRSMKGMPIMTSSRMAIQYDSTLDDMVQRIKDTPGTAGMHVMMGDARHRRALAVDRSAKYAVVRKPEDGVLFGVVLGWPPKPYVGPDWKGPGITTIDEGERPKYTWIQKLLQEGTMPLETAEDWCKLMVRPDNGLCAGSTIHTTVMVPAKGELWLHRCIPDAGSAYERFVLPLGAKTARP